MAEAKRQDAWGRASAQMALLANCHRDPKKTRAYRPSDFDPFVEPKQEAHVEVGIDILKVFVDGKVPAERVQVLSQP